MKTTTFFRSIVAAVAILTFCSTSLWAQVKIGTTPGTPDPSAMLEVQSANKGFLLPRVALTSTRDVTTIPSPASGLMVYNTTAAGSGGDAVLGNQLYVFNGTKWDLVNSYTSTTTTGGYTKKLLQLGQWPSVTNKITIEDFEFTMDYAVGSGGGDQGGVVKARLVTAPPATISLNVFVVVQFTTNGYTASSSTVSLNPSNAFTTLVTSNDVTNTINQLGEVRTFRFAYNGKVYIVEGFATGPEGTGNTWVLLVTVY